MATALKALLVPLAIALLAPTNASGLERAHPETRVGVQNQNIHVGASAQHDVTARLHLGNRAARTTIAVGYYLAPRVPLGFKNPGAFNRFGNTLRSGLNKAGFGDARALFQGSSVTGKSFRTGAKFDVGRVSDFDIALGGRGLLDRAKSLGIGLRSGGTRTGPLSAAQARQLGLGDLQSQLSGIAGRPVNFMIFDDAAAAAARSPSILVP